MVAPSSDHGLSNADIVILQALALQKKMDSGAPLTREDFRLVEPHMLRPVRPSIGDPEWMIPSGTCRALVWDAPGDGTYAPSEVPMVFTGVANRQGMAFGTGAVLGTWR